MAQSDKYQVQTENKNCILINWDAIFFGVVYSVTTALMLSPLFAMLHPARLCHLAPI